jgi:hypothetical protein
MTTRGGKAGPKPHITTGKPYARPAATPSKPPTTTRSVTEEEHAKLMELGFTEDVEYFVKTSNSEKNPGKQYVTDTNSEFIYWLNEPKAKTVKLGDVHAVAVENNALLLNVNEKLDDLLLRFCPPAGETMEAEEEKVDVEELVIEVAPSRVAKKPQKGPK